MYDGAGSCLDQIAVCVSDVVCNRHLAPVLQTCVAHPCNHPCQEAVRHFYADMPHNIAEMLVMCECADSDQSCREMRATLQSGTCVEETWVCQETLSQCVEDTGCRCVAARSTDAGASESIHLFTVTAQYWFFQGIVNNLPRQMLEGRRRKVHWQRAAKRWMLDPDGSGSHPWVRSWMCKVLLGNCGHSAAPPMFMQRGVQQRAPDVQHDPQRTSQQIALQWVGAGFTWQALKRWDQLSVKALCVFQRCLGKSAVVLSKRQNLINLNRGNLGQQVNFIWLHCTASVWFSVYWMIIILSFRLSYICLSNCATGWSYHINALGCCQ